MAATSRCKEKGCMGNPKKLIKSKNVQGYKSVDICEKCYLVHSFVENDSLIEERRQSKIIQSSEKDIEKLIKEADKKVKKLVKAEKGEQTSMF